MSDVGAVCRQAKGRLNSFMGHLVDGADERLRMLEGVPSTFVGSTCRYALSQVVTIGWLVQHSPRVDAWRWQGYDRSVVYAGSDYHMAELLHVLYPQARPASLGKVYTWDLPTRARQWAHDAELVVRESPYCRPWSSADAYSFTVSPWVRLVMDVDRSLESIVAGMKPDLRSRWRKTMNKDYICRHSHDLADFDLFYHAMLVPFAARFQERAILAPYGDLLSEFQQGGLIMVERHGQPVGGTMCLQTSSTFYANWMGLRDGDYDLVRDGAQVAMIWYGIKLAQQMGCHHYDFGRALASMQNGLLRFKRSWGAQPRSDHRLHEVWTFFSANLSTDLRRRINEQRFLTGIGGSHYIVFLGGPQLSEDTVLIDERLDIARQNGLGGVLVAKRGGWEKRSTSSSGDRCAAPEGT